MDIVKPQKGKFWENRTFKFVVLPLCLMLAVASMLWSQPSSDQKVVASKILMGEVRRGDLDIEVNGFGTLQSRNVKLLSATTAGTVEEILLKPGAVVSPQSVIVRLTNIDLVSELEQAQQSYNHELANLRQLKLNHARDLMVDKSELTELQSEWEVAKSQKKAEAQLAEEGIVSKLTFERTVLNELQLRKRIEIHQERAAQLLLLQEEEINVQSEQILIEKKRVADAQRRLDRLVVKAGMNGILQELDLEQGESVSAGQSLALVGSADDLIAEIRVPQTQADRIELGQMARVSTKQHTFTGKIIRIDPRVVGGTVTVEVAFEETLPSSTRPDQSVDGVILTEQLNDVYFVEKPINVAQMSTANVFSVTDSSDVAQLKSLNFGVETGRYIQVINGVSEGDRLILSDMSQFYGNQTLVIIQ